MNFNRVHKEVSKDTPIILVLVTVVCEPSSSSMCSVFRQVHVFYLVLLFIHLVLIACYRFSFRLAFVSILAVKRFFVSAKLSEGLDRWRYELIVQVKLPVVLGFIMTMFSIFFEVQKLRDT